MAQAVAARRQRWRLARLVCSEVGLVLAWTRVLYKDLNLGLLRHQAALVRLRGAVVRVSQRRGGGAIEGPVSRIALLAVGLDTGLASSYP